ncbi:MAG: hypothetical protein HQL71_14735 [Magnetococcales bacterium]|nr:hypothetical protein [Magnetococcales bacterium]
MKIGLYGEVVRQSVVKARELIAKRKYTDSADDIRRCRSEIINMRNDTESKIVEVLKSQDFYSLSNCRDLIFHVQEHRFTLLQIEAALQDLGLEFLGFDKFINSKFIRNKFKKQYPDKNALISLKLWHEFQTNNPDIKLAYVFWVKKISN